MYASITRVKVKDIGRVSDAARVVGETPDITAIPGFLAYYVVPGRSQYTTVAIFEDAGGVNKWHSMCREQNKDAWKLLAEGPDAVEVAKGHVIFSRTA